MFEISFLQENEDLIIVHEALNFGDCHLSIAVCSNLLWLRVLVSLRWMPILMQSQMISDTQLWHFWEHKFSQGASWYATVEWGETITRCYWLHLCMMSYTFSFWCAVVIKLNSSLDAFCFDIIFLENDSTAFCSSAPNLWKKTA